jgi:hypothetical protein
MFNKGDVPHLLQSMDTMDDVYEPSRQKKYSS